MGVPLRYNVRNLVVRRGTTLMTAVGIGLTVAVLVVVIALQTGLSEVFAGSGDPRQFLVLRKGTDAELTSTLSGETYQIVRSLPGIAKGKDGQPMVSPEGVSVVNLPSVDSPEGMNVTVRGMLPVGLEMRPVEVIAGRLAKPGLREVVVGESVAKRYPAARLGEKVRFGRGVWEVVGVFRSGESAANSEIWTDLDQLRGDFDAAGGSNSLLVRWDVPPDRAAAEVAEAEKRRKPSTAAGFVNGADTVPKFIEPFAKRIEDDQRLGAKVVGEKAYYAGLTSSGTPLQVLGYLVSVIMAVGSGFAATNTMYAAVSRRAKEIGTLRALGFGRGMILTSFTLESIFIALVGGVVGVLVTLPINGLTTGVGSFATFSETAFKLKVGWQAVLGGLAFAVLIGAVGGLLPAWAASRTGIVAAMREN